MFSLMFNQMGKFLFPSLLWYPPRNMIDLNVSESNPSQNFSALNVSSTVNFRNKKWSQVIFYMNPLSWKDGAKGQHICLSPWLYFPNLKFFPQLVWCYWGLTPHTSKILDFFAHGLIPISADGTSTRNIPVSARKCVAYAYADDHLRTGKCTTWHKEPGSLLCADAVP